jgi:type VI secretion system FHA domain protein
MGLCLEIVSHHRNGLGEIRKKEFGLEGGTIGRSLSNDWALPDKNRYLSAKHAAIDYRSGSYYIIDTSTNGVFVNESETPVGRGKPQRLFNGDRIRIGEYLIIAKIETSEDAIDLALKGHVDPVSRAQRVDSPAATTDDLIDEHVMTGVGIEIKLSESDRNRQAKTEPFSELTLETAFGDQPTTVVSEQDAAAIRPKPPASTPVQQMLAPSAPPKRPAPKVAKEKKPAEAETAAGPLSAFFRGSGLPERPLNSQHSIALLFLLGQLMREMLTGLSQSLQVRSQQKNGLRLSSTTIQPKDNNPIKFSAGPDEALENLLFRELPKEYLSSAEAVREAFRDLRAHQAFVLKAMTHAVNEYVGRLDPDVLEQKFARSSRGGLMNATNKLKYWELYRELFQSLTERERGHLPAQFLEELAQAYEAEAERDAAVRDHDRRRAPTTGTGG